MTGRRAAGARSGRAALAAACVGFFLILLDGSAVNVALPSLHGSTAVLQWVVNAYTIPLAGVLLTAGNLSDRWGARRLFLVSAAGFTLASLLCGLSPAPAELVAARLVQGVFAGGLLPTTLAVIAGTFADPVSRAKAITVWGGTGGLALVAGPIAGGLVTDLLGWRWIFLLNVPVGGLVLALAARGVPRVARRPAGRTDPAGQVTGLLALSALVAFLIEAGAAGLTAPVLLLLALAVGAGVAFVAVESRSAHPMLPPAVFRRPTFTAAILTGLAFQFGGYGIQFVLTLFLQRQQGVGALRTGLDLLPFGAAWVIGTIVVNRRLVGRGPRPLLVSGALVALAGTVLLIAGGPAVLVAATVLIGLGCGTLAPSLSAVALSSIDAARAGLGSGILSTARQVGMALGVAVLGLTASLPGRTSGLRAGAALVAVCFAAIVALSLRFVPVTRPALERAGAATLREGHDGHTIAGA